MPASRSTSLIRRVAYALAVLVVSVAIAAGVVAFLSSRDDGSVDAAKPAPAQSP